MSTQPTTSTSTTTYLDEFMDKMYLVPNDINRYLRLIRTLDKRAETVQLSLNHMQSRFLTQLREFKESVSTSSSTLTNGHSTSSNGNITKKQQQQQQQGHEVPTYLKNEYEKILTKQKELYGYFKEKQEISQQLKSMVSEFYEQLDTELKTKMKEKTEEEREVFYNQRRKAVVGGGGNNTGTSGGKMQAMDHNVGVGSGNRATGQGSKGNSAYTNTLTNNSNYTSAITNSINSAMNKQSQQQQQFTYDMKEPTYCYCLRASFGEMVMCENPFCEREWFHLDCIDEKNLPEKWYCAECQKQKEKTRNATSRGFFVHKEIGDK